MRHRYFVLLAGLILLAPSGCGESGGEAVVTPARQPFVLSEEEIAQARALSEEGLVTDALTYDFATIFIKVDLLPDSQAETSQRLVMVHHYRYLGDETVFTMVDLREHKVVRQEIAAHYPTALAPVEIERATQLARADSRLRPLLETTRVAFDARPLQYVNPAELLFGHRVVHLLLRHDGDYLMNPRVLVDLTTETVHLE